MSFFRADKPLEEQFLGKEWTRIRTACVNHSMFFVNPNAQQRTQTAATYPAAAKIYFAGNRLQDNFVLLSFEIRAISEYQIVGSQSGIGGLAK